MPNLNPFFKLEYISATSALLRRMGWGWLLCCLAALACPVCVQAQIVWDGKAGGANSSWGSANNWDPNGVPLSTNTVTFDAANANGKYAIGLGADRTTAGITFSNAAGTDAFTFSSNTLTINAGGITNNDAQTQTFSSAVTVGANQTWNAASGGLTFGTVTLNAATLTLSGSGPFSFGGTLTNSGGSRTIANNATGSVSFTAANAINITTSATPATLTFGGSGTTSVSGIIANGGAGAGSLTKIDAGTLTLSGANTYTGVTNIGTSGGANGGTLLLAANNTLPTSAASTVNIYGGTLDINTRLQTIGALNLGGGALGTTATVTGTTGVLTLGGNITYSATNDPNGANVLANLVLAGNRTFTVNNSANATDDLTLGALDRSDSIDMGFSNTLTIDGAGNTLIKSTVGVSGNTGTFTKDGTGTVTFNGFRNFYTGTTTVNDGTLILDTSNSFTDETIRGNLVIGNSTGGADSATVRYGTGLAHNKISNTSQVTINSDGVLDLNSKNDTIGSFILSGGHITTGTGVLTLSGNITTTANAADRTAVIDGVLSLGNAERTFNVADDTGTASDLTVNAAINFGSILKSGDGTMTITSDNFNGYGGTTTVSAGVLNIRHDNALGLTGVNDTTKGTTVSSGAELQLQGNLTVGTEALTLNGTGLGVAATTGALRSLSGDNTWGGAISLGTGGARINSDLDTLTLSGTITAIDQNLTVGGAGHTTINGAIGTGSGTLTKDGGGTLTLTGDNTYSGATNIEAGVVNIRHNSALGSTGAGTTVTAGAALQLQNNITVGNESLSLSGTGISTDGALRNISGDNTFGGAVTLGAGTTRINSDAGTLTLSNTLAVGANTLNAGGSGNITVSGQLTGSGPIMKDGSGTVTLQNGTNSYTGDVNVTAGTLAMGASNSLNSSSIDLTLAGTAALSLASYAQSIGTVTGTGLINFGTSGVLTLAGSSTFSGSFSGTGELIVGSGVTLTLGADFTANNLKITLAGGTLNLNGNDHSFGTLNIDATSTLDFDAGADSSLNIGSLTFSNIAYELGVNGWTLGQDMFTTPTDPGGQGAAPLNQVIFAGGWTGADTGWVDFDNQIRPVPEPSTYGALLMGMGLAFFGWRHWREKKGGRPIAS